LLLWRQYKPLPGFLLLLQFIQLPLGVRKTLL